MCGGTWFFPAAWPLVAGLSPRVRGNLAGVAGCEVKERSIPACAGEPVCHIEREHVIRVYPRVCGGTQIYSPSCRHVHGLSPRVRGNLDNALAGILNGRSIPACAGEPIPLLILAFTPSVYPRVCGGTYCAPQSGHSRFGLSPRVRGNLRRKAKTSWCQRSIPACAGEPIKYASKKQAFKVYPRVCGGTTGIGSSKRRPMGLSPRVRGNRSLSWRQRNQTRSIPACAGEPSRSSVAAWMLRVYPRVCGGTGRIVSIRGRDRGLSPRVRGNRRSAGLPRG